MPDLKHVGEIKVSKVKNIKRNNRNIRKSLR